MIHLQTSQCILVIIWLGMVGGCIGSFLNVVVYRVPAGMSLLHPGSHCPICGHPIRWYHNLPVLGWLLLRGRCHDCKAPISIQYPLVEAVTAAMFIILALGMWLGPGDCQAMRPYWGFAYQPRFFFCLDKASNPPWEPLSVVGIFAYYQFLLCTLLVIMLIDHTGKNIPWRVGTPAVIIGLISFWIWPFAYINEEEPVGILMRYVVGLFYTGSGLVTGLIGGRIGGIFLKEQERQDFLLAAFLTGLFLGWQAAFVITFICVIAYKAWKPLHWFMPHGAILPPSIMWLVCALVWILLLPPM